MDAAPGGAGTTLRIGICPATERWASIESAGMAALRPTTKASHAKTLRQLLNPIRSESLHRVPIHPETRVMDSQCSGGVSDGAEARLFLAASSEMRFAFQKCQLVALSPTFAAIFEKSEMPSETTWRAFIMIAKSRSIS